jgi:hypothetical protein
VAGGTARTLLRGVFGVKRHLPLEAVKPAGGGWPSPAGERLGFGLVQMVVGLLLRFLGFRRGVRLGVERLDGHAQAVAAGQNRDFRGELRVPRKDLARCFPAALRGRVPGVVPVCGGRSATGSRASHRSACGV